MFNRWHICEAYALYDMMWGPTPYGARLHRIRFRMAPCRTLENAEPEVKEIYGRLVRQHNALYVAYERLYRRNPKIGAWPGTQNLKTDARNWLKQRGLLQAVESYDA